MKKIILIMLILIFPLIVKADLTKEQQDDVAAFAKILIIKGNGSEHKNGKFGILAYDQNNRDAGFNGELAQMYKDYKGINDIDAKKWVFDCSSFAAYVYYHTFGINTLHSNAHPYVVTGFINDASSQKNFYFVMNNVDVSSLDYSRLQKGDILIYTTEHVMVYVGDGYIAHFSSSAIKKDTNIGCEVVLLKEKYPYMKISVARIKNGVIPTSKKANTTIKWPDTGKTEDLTGKTNTDTNDKPPVVNVTYTDIIAPSIEVSFSFSDDKALTGYQITKTTPNSYIRINNQKTHEVKYTFKNNGTYYAYARDSKGQISKKEFIINNIDNTKPEITNIVYSYNTHKNNFNIEIKATDTNKLFYSLDKSKYQENNKFNDVAIGNHTIEVMDAASNITEYNLSLSNELIPTINLNYDTNYTNVVKVSIVGIDKKGISGYNVTRTKDAPIAFIPYQNGTVYPIKINGTYYFWIKNMDGVVVYKSITINNIDANGPIVNDVKIKRNKTNFYVDIDAVDVGCGMGSYSLDGINYQDNNIFSEVDTVYESIYVKDKCDNITIYKVDLNSISEDDDNTSTLLLVGIIVVVFTMIMYNILTMKKKRH